MGLVGRSELLAPWKGHCFSKPAKLQDCLSKLLLTVVGDLEIMVAMAEKISGKPKLG